MAQHRTTAGSVASLAGSVPPRVTVMTAPDEAGRLSPYVPRTLSEWGAGEARWKFQDGTLLFLDVSGFTALSERMARRGPHGAELVTDALNLVFGTLLDISAAAGGDLLKFGGDALLVFFAGDGHARRGAQAAVAMRRALRHAGSKRSTGGVTLRASFGLASGPVFFALAGGEYDELVVAGVTTDRAMEAEAAAASGQILASASAAALLPASWLGAGSAGLVEVTAASRIHGPPAERSLPERDLTRSLPPAVVAAISAGALPGEHRLAAVAFIKFKGLGALLAGDGPAAALGAILTTAQRAAAHHGLCVIGTDIDSDGGKLILTAGVPVAIDDAESLAILAALEVIQAGGPLILSAGVYSGRVFSGDVGSQGRRTFTLIGDAVNTAARVAARAYPGHVLVSVETLAAARTLFETSAPVTFTAKGKSAPLVARAVASPLGRRGDTQDSGLPFVGREAVLRTLQEAVAEPGGAPLVVDITGDAGIGKSRLVAEFLKGLPGVPILSARTAAYSRQDPFRAAVPALRAALGIPVAATRDEAGTALTNIVRGESAALAPMLPLLAEPFDAAVRPTLAASRIDPRFRPQRQQAAVRTVLAARLPGFAVLVVEDRQWLDDASRGLLESLAGEGGPPWLTITTSRSVEGQIGGASRRREILLSPLDPAETRKLATAFADTMPRPAYFVSDAIDRSGGNPLFLIDLLRDDGAGTGSLPETVEQLVANRLDRLGTAERRQLEALAVAGTEFEVEMAAAALGTTGSETQSILHSLALFIERTGAGSYQFRDRLYQEGAYRMLSFRSRREAHTRIARFLETQPGPRANGLLAFHWWEAGDDARAFVLLESAAEEARARHANLDAAANYRRALSAGARLATVDRVRRRQLFEALGDVLEITGQFGAAEDAFQRALRFAPGDLRLLLKRATIHERRGQYPTAVRLLRRGLRLNALSEVRDPALDAEMLTLLAGVRFRQGNLGDAASTAGAAVAEAEAANRPVLLAHAYYLLGHVEALRGNADGREYLLRALPLIEAAGDLVRKANLLNNLGVEAYFAGDLEAAIGYYEESRRARESSGDVVGAATSQNNIAEALSDVGRLDEAESLLREARATWRGAGYPVGVAIATQNLGRIATRRGRFDEADTQLRDAAAQFRAIGADEFVLEARTLAAENLLLSGRAAAAEAECEEAGAEAGGTQQTAAMAGLLVARGKALAAMSRHDDARSELSTAAETARAAGASSHLAEAEAALARLPAATN